MYHKYIICLIQQKWKEDFYKFSGQLWKSLNGLNKLSVIFPLLTELIYTLHTSLAEELLCLFLT